VREHSQCEASSLGVPHAQYLLAHRGGHIIERRVDRSTFSREQDRCRKRRKCQICGREAIVNQKPAAVTQAHGHFLKDTAHALE
jgi:hypothetical protein